MIRQQLIKYIFIEDVKELIRIAILIGDIYNENVNISKMRNFMLCKRFSEISAFILRLVFILYPLGIALLLAQPIYQAISTGLYDTPPFSTTFPNCIEQSTYGLVFEWFHNFLVAGVVAYVGVVCDVLIYLIFANMLFVSSIITGHLDDFEESLLDPDNTLRITRSRMRSTILMILEYNKQVFYLNNSQLLLNDLLIKNIFQTCGEI